MATAATSLLGLALPVTGELSGTWGDTVNVSITALLDTAVAGTTTLSSDADVTLTTTTLAANQARQAIILWTAGGTVTRTITVPAQSKSYIVINKTSSSQSIKIVGVGPTTGVTIVAGTAAFVVWNGVDFVTVSVTSTTGILPVANGGTGLSSGTSGGVLAYTATGTLASSTALAASALVIGGGAGAAPSTTTTGAGVVTALGVNVGTAGAFVVNGGALGTPSSGTVTNLTGTASININGTVGATTANTGAFTTLSATVADGTNAVTVNGNTVGGFIALRPDGTNGQAIRIGGSGAGASTLRFLGTGDVEYMRLTSTGLAVTGTLSATGDITSTGAIKANLNGTNAYALLQADSSGAAGGKIWTLASNATGSAIGTAGGLSVRSSTDSITVANFTSTGLAVTGTLSATDLGSAGNTVLTTVYKTGSTGSVISRLQTAAFASSVLDVETNDGSGSNYRFSSTIYDSIISNSYAGANLWGNLNFATGGVIRATIVGGTGATAGNVGIGTTSPVSKLEVVGAATSTQYFQRSIAPATESGIETAVVTTGNASTQRAGMYAFNNYATNNATDLIFKSNDTTGSATERVRISAAGDVTISNGNLIVGTAGKGIDFSATSSGTGTMTSELLADYEEGTWTPTAGSGLTVTGTFVSSGTYTKVGRLVTVNFTISATLLVCSNSTQLIAGLPFSHAADSIGSNGVLVNAAPNTMFGLNVYGSAVTLVDSNLSSGNAYGSFTYPT